MWWIIGFFLLLILFPVILKILPPIIFKKLNNYTLLLNTNSLHSQYLFQVVILLPLILSLYLMIWIGSEYPFRLDSIGFNSFLNIQKFPLGILALSPILGAFVVYAHRSLQTDKQIKTAEKQLEEAQKKNKVDIYFSQRKFIIEQLENIQISYYGKIDNANYVYDRFRKFDNYDDKLIIKSFDFIDLNMEEIYASFTYIKEYINNIDDYEDISNNLIETLKNICKRITRIITTSRIQCNDFKIKNTVNSYIEKYNYYMLNKLNSIDNYDYDLKKELDILLDEIIIELSILRNFLEKLFTIILLDSDVSRLLPRLLPSLNKFHFQIGT